MKICKSRYFWEREEKATGSGDGGCDGLGEANFLPVTEKKTQ